MASHLFSVSGRVALISGGGSGIGAYIAEGLAHAGCIRVYIIGRWESFLQRIASKSPSILLPFVGVLGDVSTKAGCVKIAEEFARREREVGVASPALDILVNNAGVRVH